MSVHLTLQGQEELARLLEKFPSELQDKFTKRALGDSANLVLQAAQRLVPRRTGGLAETLTMRKETKAHSLRAVVFVDASRSPTMYNEALVTEFGTHRITATPFLRPALINNQTRVINYFILDINDLIDKARAGKIKGAY